ncbi:hypothetical protein DEU56DRAFT_279972 [Suillus clintonianus]|uniref:uncharacterized protein n=1 Tax=Suillus clintonianus TaxID=1904413 RepID=UPI001B86B774|nr:uncharacterized protein DEU56DRAFT_279972 [Suillus clintonianus]KAG2141017.1 hypothetical protein DEU56DRAFT_279972 [Suillus clintonianus]
MIHFACSYALLISVFDTSTSRANDRIADGGYAYQPYMSDAEIAPFTMETGKSTTQSRSNFTVSSGHPCLKTQYCSRFYANRRSRRLQCWVGVCAWK